MGVLFFRNLQTSYLTCRDRGILQKGYSLWPRSGCSYYNVATPNQRTLPIYYMRTRWAVLWVWALVTSISILRAVFVCFFLCLFVVVSSNIHIIIMNAATSRTIHYITYTKLFYILWNSSIRMHRSICWLDWFLIFGVLTPLSAIFQLYHGDQF